jgi:3-oxoacyl-[acyl-carrier protein] reductase
MTTLVFGSTGSVGQHICTHLPDAVPLTRNHYDLSKPDDFSGLETFDNIKCIIWCSGMNTNDAIGTMEIQTYDDMMNVNVNSIVKSLDYFEKANKLSRGARVCIISSILQESGRIGKLSYCVSKSAIGGLIRAASITLKERDILINAILPGPIDNEMTKMTLSTREYESLKSYFVSLEDIFSMCHLLCFNNNSITGQSISIDNGISVKITY